MLGKEETNMRTAPLGKTGLTVTRTALGCLPLQRRTTQEAVELIRAAYQEGITLYDTARSYTDSEYKLGLALEGVRDQVVIATKTPSTTVDGIKRDLETSLNMLKTDYVDIYQFHNPAELPLGDSPLYRQMEEFKRQGMIRHIGLTNHSADIALAAAESGLYETIQYPLSPLCTDRDLSVIATCQRLNIGLLAMKALSGGLITRAALSFAFLDRFEGVFPLWGIQHRWELEDIVALESDPPRMTGEMQQAVEALRRELSGDFCRGCGYCLPCPAGIPINMAARMSLLLRRAPWQSYTTPQWQDNMARIDACLDCGACESRCPYHLPTRKLLAKNLVDYRSFVEAHCHG